MTKELVPSSFLNTDEYEGLIEECQAILTEGVFNFRMEKILTYGRLGERIVEDILYKKYNKGNTNFLGEIAKDIGISYSELYRAVQFYTKFKIVSPDDEGFNRFEEGKNISWSKIKQKYLPAELHKDCEHTWEKIEAWRCKQCKKVNTFNPYVKSTESNR